MELRASLSTICHRDEDKPVNSPAMAEVGWLSSELDGVAHLLRDHTLEVPLYQRSYAWYQEQVEAFWHDLRAALVAEQSVYFLGTVVLSGSDAGGRVTVIDGQQRLATTSMLLSAARNAFQARGDERRASVVETKYVASTSLASASLEPRIRMNAIDQDFFEQYVVSNPQTVTRDEASSESNKRIADAFDLLTAKLEEDLDSAGPRWQQRLMRWIDFLDTQVKVIAVQVRDDADAFLIFETLNDRGLDLTTADVIKNYLLGLRRDRLAVAEQTWSQALKSVEESAGDATFTTFLRQWWSTQNGPIRERELYRSLKRAIQSSDQAAQALSDIERSAPRFAALLSPQDEFWATYPEETRHSIEALNLLGLEQYRPLLLAALEAFGPVEVSRLSRALVSWLTRGLVVGGIGGGTTERYYAEAARRVSLRRAGSTEDVLRELDAIIPDDKEFHANFSTRRVVKSGLVSYYLTAVAKTARRDAPAAGFPDLLLPPEIDVVAVPVVPRRNADPAWRHWMSLDLIGNWSARLGNYLLVPRSVASALPRDPEGRTGVLDEHGLMPDWWPAHLKWDEYAIQRRQEQLASLAVSTWPRAPENFLEPGPGES
jgi:hypothetical protein